MSTIESAVYENRTYGAVRGRGLVTPSYSIIICIRLIEASPVILSRPELCKEWSQCGSQFVFLVLGFRKILT